MTGRHDRTCEWCHGALGSSHPRARTCSRRCRQAKSRFRVAAAAATAEGQPKRFGYADPPYVGLSRKYYSDVEVDHVELLARLVDEFPDGWALSASSESARAIWQLCPPETRLCPWVRSFRAGKSRRPHKRWEALFVCGGREYVSGAPSHVTDSLVWSGRQSTHPGALTGMKPAAFSEWMFLQLGAAQGDDLVDLFPGSGAVSRAWQLFVGGGSPGTLRSRFQESMMGDA